jgi:hypothetical protein
MGNLSFFELTILVILAVLVLKFSLKFIKTILKLIIAFIKASFVSDSRKN